MGVSITIGETTSAQSPLPSTVSDYFEKHVRPLLAKRCFDCHAGSEDELESGLSLESREGILRGGQRGPAAVPTRPEESLIVHAIGYSGELQMPPTKKLADEEIAHLEKWVEMGLPWPESTAIPYGAPSEKAAKSKDHWAFQPVRRPALPSPGTTPWGNGAVDRFIYTQLEAASLKPSPQADRRTLIRRATLNLTGIPPTPEEVDRFEADSSPDAYPKLIDRLLNSPGYGERWGRHWLDVARYADTKGYNFRRGRRYPFSYTYRDYVIASLNADLPYDQFLLEQMAADLLPSAHDTSTLAALGFLTVGRKFNRKHLDIDDQIDVVTRGLMGLTVACARCHDHKYEAIPTDDYYSLYGVFANTEEPDDLDELPLIGTPEDARHFPEFKMGLDVLQQAVDDYLEKHLPEYQKRKKDPDLTIAELPRHLDGDDRKDYRRLQEELDEYQVESETAPPRAMILRDRSELTEPVVMVRGNPDREGRRVPRQFLRLLSGDERVPFTKGSGRLEMAQAITHPENPLTARVMVNRVWMHHFGEPLVSTPSDFGVRSDPPSHPALLDYLTSNFMANEWSLKGLHREIMLSETFQQESARPTESGEVDPENRLLWRMNRRPLEFEALRDSILAATGQLETTIGGRPVDLLDNPPSRRRTVYGFIDRQDLPNLFRTFDFANPDQSSARRPKTTVPQQALFLMNSPFTRELVESLAASPPIKNAANDSERIKLLYRAMFTRMPTAKELASSERFLESAANAKGMSPLAQLGQVLLFTNEFLFSN